MLQSYAYALFILVHLQTDVTFFSWPRPYLPFYCSSPFQEVVGLEKEPEAKEVREAEEEPEAEEEAEAGGRAGGNINPRIQHHQPRSRNNRRSYL